MIMVKINNLEAEMKRKGISRNDIARLLGVSYRTIHSKFNGESQWQYTECILIQKREIQRRPAFRKDIHG